MISVSRTDMAKPSDTATESELTVARCGTLVGNHRSALPRRCPRRHPVRTFSWPEHAPRRALLAALCWLACLAAAPTMSAPPRPPVTVFAAASLKNALDDVAKAYGDAAGVRV